MNRRRLALYAAAAAARARSVATARFGGVAILLYHRVAVPDADPQLLAVDPSRFEEQLVHLRDHCTPVALSDVPALLRARRLPPRPVAVTFDDGYRDNLVAAKPLLERYGIPATVFVASGYVGSGREFWWDELERLLLTHDGSDRDATVDVRAADATARISVGDAATRRVAYTRLHMLLRPRPAAAIDGVLATLRAWAGEPDAGLPRADRLPLDHAELLRLDGGAVAIGAHTRTHVSLAAQPAAVQRSEVVGSTTDLADWLGHDVTAFSYPFGSPGIDVSWRARTLARQAGHDVAVVNWPRAASALDSRFALPRHIVRDWPGERFAAWLHGEVLAS